MLTITSKKKLSYQLVIYRKAELIHIDKLTYTKANSYDQLQVDDRNSDTQGENHVQQNEYTAWGKYLEEKTSSSKRLRSKEVANGKKVDRGSKISFTHYHVPSQCREISRSLLHL